MKKMNHSPQLSPAYNGRQPIVDAVRGFSLLGILLSNMPLFMYGLDITSTPEIYPISQTAFNVLEILIIGSFYPIFLFIFGYGTQQLTHKLEASHERPKSTLLRRFFMLCFLGILHFILIWDGDILLSYGVMGLMLLLFINRKIKTLLIWTILIGILILLVNMGYSENTPGSQNYYNQAQLSLGNGSYSEAVRFRLMDSVLEGMPGFVFLILSPIAFLVYLPIALLGIIAARQGWFMDPVSKRGTYIKYALIFVGSGILLNLVGVLLKDSTIGYFLVMTGGPVLAFGYIFLFAYMYTRSQENGKLKKAFTSIGKLSLTNYLLHSMICTCIFYGYGLGLFGQLGMIGGTVLALVIYALTAGLSYLYLQRFQTGPVEWLLRKVTYRSYRTPMKRNVSG
ncbi:DUF418 domain-containing protein [Neobacillus mesonae]|nr:DUF418 domain-containing protein [Neobacillus mesonae]